VLGGQEEGGFVLPFFRCPWVVQASRFGHPGRVGWCSTSMNGGIMSKPFYHAPWGYSRSWGGSLGEEACFLLKGVAGSR